jgi:hypothetical protein
VDAKADARTKLSSDDADALNARLIELSRRVEDLEHRLRDHGWRLRDVVVILQRAGDTEVAGYLSELVRKLEDGNG